MARRGRPVRFVGINFDHMHMGDLLRLVHAHPQAEIAGVCDGDPSRMAAAVAAFGIPRSRVFTDVRRCLEVTEPDVAILCPATGRHAEYVERVAPYRVHVLVEKPFAASVGDADRMIAAMRGTGRRMAINWPLAWYPVHRTAKRLVDEGRIGEVIEVHYSNGNRGPLRHLADKIEVSEAEARRRMRSSWWYRKREGGGSLQDYLGYGTTLGTWFHGGAKPLEVTAAWDQGTRVEVDEHSVTIARYRRSLSTFRTRWGAFTDPWTHQPQPKCGFVIVGTDGTISSYDYEPAVRVQTRKRPEGFAVPVDRLRPPHHDPISHFIHAIETGAPLLGPLDPVVARIGQQIVDTAFLSATLKRTLPLVRDAAHAARLARAR